MLMKYYAFGDTGGHLNVLKNGLKNINVDVENYNIPEGITIIHLGDLIHKGKSSLSALTFVERMIAHNPGRWIQLIGNHELQHLEEANLFWRCKCPPEVKETITRMISEGTMLTAYALKDVEPAKMEISARFRMKPENKDWLFVHGGLTSGWWDLVHKSEPDVTLVADGINALSTRHKDVAGERMGLTGIPSPVWASAPTEVFTSWEGVSMPFNQMVGHTYPFDWESECWYGNRATVKEYIKSTVLNPNLRVALTLIEGSLLAVIDPAFETKAPSIDAQPAVLFGTKDID